MAYKTGKTYSEEAAKGLKRKIERWDKSALGAQIGGLIHDAVALTIAKGDLSKKIIRDWLDTLYEIAEEKKAEITTPKPLTEKDFKQAKEMGEGILEQEKQEKDEKLDTINRDLGWEAEQNEPELSEERRFEESPKNNKF